MPSINMDDVRRQFNDYDNALRQSARAKTEAADPYGLSTPTTDMLPYRYVREVWTDFLIVESEGRRKSTGLQKVPYEVNDKGVASFGTPKGVRMEYVELSASSELLWQSPEYRLRKESIVRRTGNYDSAVDHLVTLAGSVHVGSYERTSKSGKSVHVSAYTRSPGDMSAKDIAQELHDISEGKSGLSDQQARARKTALENEVAARKRTGTSDQASGNKKPYTVEFKDHKVTVQATSMEEARVLAQQDRRKRKIGNLAKSKDTAMSRLRGKR